MPLFSLREKKEALLYRNNLKNQNFCKPAPQNAYSQQAAIAKGQGASENRHRTRFEEIVSTLTIAMGFSLLIGLMAPIKIYLPYMSVPFIMQSSMLVLCASALPLRICATAVLFLFVQAGIGLPVLSSGATSWMLLTSPTTGYLLGYLLAPYATSCMYRASLEYKMIGATLLIYLFGWTWLSMLIGCQAAFWQGVAPFVVPDIFKAMVLLSAYRKVVR